MATEAMMAMSGLVLSPFTRNQLARTTKDSKHTISTHAQRRRSFDAHQVVQLARSQLGLATPLFQDEVHHLLVLADSRVKSAITLVIRLARNTHEQASPGNAQVLDLPLREDLPGGFFTTETP